ncbi:MAG: ATP-dependent helicase [Bacilli bacterium]
MISEQKKKFVSPEIYDGNKTFKRLYFEYNQFLLEQNAIDFDDILFYAYIILIENPSIQNLYGSLYKYVCVDESQDLNYAQYELIKALCGNNIKNIMFVGDANQSIYGFNGSNSDLMTEEFVRDFNPQIFELNENFRSAKSIVNYANRLENTDSTSSYYYEGEVKAYECENEEDEAKLIIQRIQELSISGHPDIENIPEYGDFAVIARNRYALALIEEKLMHNNIPYYYKKTVSGIECESKYAKVFDLLLRVFLNELDTVHLNELYSVAGIKNLTSVSIEDLLLKTEYAGLVGSLQFMSEEDFAFGKALKFIEEELQNCNFNEDEKYLILKDLEQWSIHWKKYCSMVPRENRTLLSFRNSISLGRTQDVSSDNGVALLTAHMSKGLQYEVVFVVGLSEGTFPDYRAVSSGTKALEQEKNNMFVAATRAKRLCYFTYPKYKKMPWGDLKFQKKSRYLDNLPIEKVLINE